MKRLFVLMSCAVLLSACATRSKPMAAWTPPPTATSIQTDANGNVIENVPFRAGVSSVTVEKMAEAQGCTGGAGAGLMTPQGPVEMYRMICENRQVFVARCELRQCRQVSYSPPASTTVVRVPADSNVYVATIPANTAPGASGTAVLTQPVDAVPAGPLTARQVPRLAFYWKCGECIKNEYVPPMIGKAYEQAALKNGYTVSDGETAAVSIVEFRERGSAQRFFLGILAGKDKLSTKISFRGQTLMAEDYMLNAWIGTEGMSENVGRKAFEQLRGPK